MVDEATYEFDLKLYDEVVSIACRCKGMPGAQTWEELKNRLNDNLMEVSSTEAPAYPNVCRSAPPPPPSISSMVMSNTDQPLAPPMNVNTDGAQKPDLAAILEVPGLYEIGETHHPPPHPHPPTRTKETNHEDDAGAVDPNEAGACSALSAFLPEPPSTLKSLGCSEMVGTATRYPPKSTTESLNLRYKDISDEAEVSASSCAERQHTSAALTTATLPLKEGSLSAAFAPEELGSSEKVGNATQYSSNRLLSPSVWVTRHHARSVSLMSCTSTCWMTKGSRRHHLVII